MINELFQDNSTNDDYFYLSKMSKIDSLRYFHFKIHYSLLYSSNAHFLLCRDNYQPVQVIFFPCKLLAAACSLF